MPVKNAAELVSHKLNSLVLRVHRVTVSTVGNVVRPRTITNVLCTLGALDFTALVSFPANTAQVTAVARPTFPSNMHSQRCRATIARPDLAVSLVYLRVFFRYRPPALVAVGPVCANLHPTLGTSVNASQKRGGIGLSQTEQSGSTCAQSDCVDCG